jgi:hypothetical protein
MPLATGTGAFLLQFLPKDLPDAQVAHCMGMQGFFEKQG